MAKDSKKNKKPTNKSGPSFRQTRLMAVVVAVVAFAVYSNTLNHGYVLDDVSAITENTLVKKGSEGVFKSEVNIWNTDYRYGYWNEPGSLYRPLALTLFAWQWEFWPNNPVPAHWINVILYATVCALLFLMFGLWTQKLGLWPAFFAALIFAVHPIHTEVAANIKSADELLAFLFSLIALLALWGEGSRSFGWRSLVALASYFLALTSKESVVTLILVVPLMFYWFSDHSLKHGLMKAVWLLVPLGFYFMLRASVLGSVSGTDITPMIDNILVDADGAQMLATAFKLCGLYLLKLFFPHPLSHDYSFDEISLVTFASPWPWLSLLAFGALAFLVWKQWKSKSVLSFAILFFFLTFSLYTNIVFRIGTHFGERLLFLPSAGFALAIGWLIWRWGKGGRDVFTPSKALIPLAAFSLLMVAFAAKTIARNGDWKSEVDLYESDVINAPNSSRTHYRLGMAYMKERAVKTTNEAEKKQWLQKSVKALQESVRIYPEYADAQGELGLAYQRLGMQEEAVKHYNIALELNPSHHTTLNNLGTVFFDQGKFDRAIELFTKALAKNPRYKDAAGNLASAYGMSGQYAEALKWFGKAIEIDPNEASYYYFTGITYRNMGDEVNAEAWLNKAYKMKPELRPK